MYSLLNPNFVYDDVSGDITETDIDVVSDLWSMDGRNVYRGSRDPRYTHANVYWLYDEDLQRVGCSEHSRSDHGDFRLLWFQESDFGTLLQEEGWTMKGDLWGHLPQRTFERFVNEGWTTPELVLDHCLYGPTRILTPSMLVNRPTVYTCQTCGRRTLKKESGCLWEESSLSVPSRDSVLFIDSDMVVHVPPPGSRVWSMPGLPCDDSLPSSQQEQVLEQVPLPSVESELTPPVEPPHQVTPEEEFPLQSSEQAEAPQESPDQSHLQTPVQQTSSGEESRAHT